MSRGDLRLASRLDVFLTEHGERRPVGVQDGARGVVLGHLVADPLQHEGSATRVPPLTDQESEHQLSSWTQASNQLQHEVKYLRERIEELADTNKQTIAAVEQMSHMPELRPFVVASGLVDA